jgi:3-oxoacyl-[acyl-carrier-protein] synthase III
MAYIRSFGRYLPERVVANEELATRLGCDTTWIVNASGIEQRRYAGPDETVAAMGVRAAEDCLSRAQLQPGQVGLVISTSGSAERRFPGPGCEIAQALGIPGTPAIDLPMASAGALFGLALADQLSSTYGNILLVASEKMSAAVNSEPLNRNTAILFGDGAGAALISSERGMAAIRRTVLHSDGAFAGDLKVELNCPLHMNGHVIILQASRKIPDAIAECLALDDIEPAAVQTFITHQANRNLIVRVARALNVSSDRFYCNIERYGNTSSASMLIAASEWCEQQGFLPGAHVAFAAFGAGFHWGAVTATGL